MTMPIHEPRWRLLPSEPSEVGESPVWSVQEQALYWVDIEGRRIHRWAWGHEASESWQLTERIGCISLHASGGLVVAMQSGIVHWHAGKGDHELLCAAPYPATEMRFNDGRCDRRGRLWVTTMLLANPYGKLVGELYRLCPYAGLTGPHLRGLGTGNGLAFSEDGQQAFMSDSHASVQKVWRFRMDEQGTLLPGKLLVDMKQFPGRPDGAAVDAAGHYWSCANDAGLIHRFTALGELIGSWRVPVAKPSMCAFGGRDLDQLFVTSIKPDSPIDGYDAELAGRTFVLDLQGVRGLPEPAFGSQPMTSD